MATVNLVNDPESVVTGNDNIVIVKVIDTIRGGRSLDVTGYTPSVIPAGHVIIRETATDEYKPMPVNSGNTAYGTLPADHVYAGVLIASIPTDRPFAGIMIRGVVNPAASTLPLTTIQSAVSTALPHIIFQAD